MTTPPTANNITPEEFFRSLQNSIFGRLSSSVMLYRDFFEASDHVAHSREPSCNVMRPIRRILCETIVIGLCRLFDPSHTKIHRLSRENLSLKALETRLTTDPEKKVHARLIRNWFEKHNSNIKSVQCIRNRLIGHLDASTYWGTETFPDCSPKLVLTLFDEVNRLMNDLGTALVDAVTDHGRIENISGKAMLNCIARGYAYSDLILKINSGQVGPDGILPKILRDFGLPDSAAEVERGDLRGFPSWQCKNKQRSGEVFKDE